MRPARQDYEIAGCTYFVSSQTAQRKPLFHHEAWALLLIDVLEHYRNSSYLLHAFVIMPDHFHALVSPAETLERSVKNIKGGFSFRAKRAFARTGDIWQTGFSDHRIRDVDDGKRHIAYIERNPARRSAAGPYPYLHTDLDPIPQRLKPHFNAGSDGGAKAPPLQQSPKLSIGTAAEAARITASGLTIRRPVASTSIIEREHKQNAPQK